MERRSRVRMLDVARAAGVSHSTASRALNGHPKVSATAQAAVADAARELGYVRDLRAADLASSRATTIGLLIRAAERPFYGALAAQLQTETEGRDVDLLTASGGDDVPRQTRAVQTLLGHGVGGILIASGRASAQAVEYAASFVPTVTIGLGLVRPGVDAVHVAAESEIGLAEQVSRAGHTHVAVTASSNELAHALHARTANFLTSLVVSEVRTTIIASRTEDSRQLRDGLRAAIDAGATAVMAGEDMAAVRILEYLDEWGVRCPDEVSVTGFDGVGPYRSPLFGLTTVAQPVEHLAKEALDLMERRLRGDQTTIADIRLPGRLVHGRTLGQPPGART
ncbi:LacI family DNA-binding transcriptional regulator [Micropruina sp.]|uniref:LacI family DNA-binding transcriptional regulator n=1 Tax=Micropruina sp. TaxID=2737536 RepID=UPI0039E28AC8